MKVGMRSARVFAYTIPADMRKGFCGLSGLVRNELGRDLLSGDLFLFISRNGKRAKVLFFDGTGLVIYSKRLEKARFAPLRHSDGTLRMTVSELALFLEGSTRAGQVSLSPRPLALKDLALFRRA